MSEETRPCEANDASSYTMSEEKNVSGMLLMLGGKPEETNWHSRCIGICGVISVTSGAGNNRASYIRGWQRQFGNIDEDSDVDRKKPSRTFC